MQRTTAGTSREREHRCIRFNIGFKLGSCVHCFRERVVVTMDEYNSISRGDLTSGGRMTSCADAKTFEVIATSVCRSRAACYVRLAPERCRTLIAPLVSVPNWSLRFFDPVGFLFVTKNTSSRSAASIAAQIRLYSFGRRDR